MKKKKPHKSFEAQVNAYRFLRYQSKILKNQNINPDTPSMSPLFINVRFQNQVSTKRDPYFNSRRGTNVNGEASAQSDGKNGVLTLQATISNFTYQVNKRSYSSLSVFLSPDESTIFIMPHTDHFYFQLKLMDYNSNFC